MTMPNPTIPDDVLADAARREWDSENARWGSDDAWVDADESQREVYIIDVRAAAAPIADWARNQALEEALVVVNNMAADMAADGECGVATALNVLSEEVNYLRYRYDPEYDYD